MPRRGERDPKRERFWRRAMKAWARSGQTMRGYCAEHGLTETTFHAWRRELRKRDGEREGGAGGLATQRRSRAKARARQGAARTPSRSRFVPVRVTAAPAPIEIERDGTTIRLHGDIDPEALARILEAVGRVPC